MTSEFQASSAGPHPYDTRAAGSSLVSIIIPAYNAAPWLAETLESALGQTWATKEVIVVDDGSTDDTAAIARTFEPRGVRLVSQSNAGLSAARNAGLRVARGDYVQFLDADDLVSPDKIERQVLLLQGGPAGAVAIGRWARFRRDVARSRFGASPYWRDMQALEYLAGVARTGNSVPVHAWLVPRAIVDAVGPFAEELRVMEDHEYFARVALASAGLRFCREGCSYYRTFHARSLSRQHQESVLQSSFRAVELVVDRLLGGEPSPQARQIAADYYQWVAFRLYPEQPDLVRLAQQRSEALGGSRIPPPLGRRAAALSRVIGWRAVQRLRAWLWRMGIYLGKHDVIAD
jgi:glycosyltransferase involved in cell wall biosynthesis